MRNRLFELFGLIHDFFMFDKIYTFSFSAYQNNDITEFEKILKTNHSNIMDDPFIREHIEGIFFLLIEVSYFLCHCQAVLLNGAAWNLTSFLLCVAKYRNVSKCCHRIGYYLKL